MEPQKTNTESKLLLVSGLSEKNADQLPLEGRCEEPHSRNLCLSARRDDTGPSSLRGQLRNTALCRHHRDASFSVQKQLRQGHLLMKIGFVKFTEL